MASYQVRQRDPLLDQGTQAMLERRGRELFGVFLILLGLAFVAMLGSYSPDDPGWMVATVDPAQNMLGRFGAAMASTLIIISGKGVWAIPMILLAWGARFITHRGADRVIGRSVFAVIAICMASVYAATLVPGAAWQHTFGVGGLFGDTVLGALLGMAPMQAGIGLKIMSLMTGAALLALLLYVTGFERAELRSIARFLMLGTVMTYSTTMTLLGKGAVGTVHAARGLQERRAERRALLMPTEPPVARTAGPAPLSARRPTATRREPPVTEPAAWGAPDAMRAEMRYNEPLEPIAAPKLGLIARIRRAVEPEPELFEPTLSADMAFDAPSEDRIKARIGDAIRARARGVPPITLSPIAAAIARREPPVLRPRGPTPLIADTSPRLMAEVEEDGEDPANMFVPEADFDDDIELPYRPAVTEDRRPMVQHAMRKPAMSRQATAEAQPRLRFDDPQPTYELPPLNLLAAPTTVVRHTLSDEALEENARMLESVLDDYGVKGEIVSVRPGPVVTMYELEPAPGLKASRVIGLADDIARSMSALSARVSTVPGRTVIGIELPNATREKVVLREILSARDFGDSSMRLPLALGKDIGGEPIIANLAKMPHL